MEYEMVEGVAQENRTTNPSLIWHPTPEIQAGQRPARRAMHIPEEDVQLG